MHYREHTPDPFSGWFVCGWQPGRHPATPQPGDEVTPCPRCAREVRERGITRAQITEAHGDMLGAADPDSYRFQKVRRADR